MVLEDMEFLKVTVGATSLTMHDRFTHLAEIPPLQKAGPLRARRMSTNEGPLLSNNLQTLKKNQQIVDEVLHQLGLDWRVQELQQDRRSRAGSMSRSRAGSMPRSRAGSMSRYGSQNEMSRHFRSNSQGNLSRASSVGNVSQHSGWSGRSGRSNGGQSVHSRAMSFMGPDLNKRLQMRNAWLARRNMRARGRGRYRGRGRGRGRGGYNQQQGRQFYQQRTRWNYQRQWQRGWQDGRQQWLRNQWNRQGRQQQGWRLRRAGYAQSVSTPMTPRGRAGQENPGYSQNRGGAGRGRRGRGGQNAGGSQSNKPGLVTLEQLDKELEEYMASTPALLDKQLDEYMAQSGLTMDTD